MKIGFGFNGVWIPLRDAIHYAWKAERLGLDSVWIAEDGWITGRDAITVLACIGYITEHVALGTNLIPVYHNRHLHLTAATIAAIDDISGGRMIAGIGAGTGWPSYPKDVKPLKMMRDAILGIRALLLGQSYELDGREIYLKTDEKVFSWNVPEQVRVYVPIILGARGPKMTHLAGELADGILLELWVPTSCVPSRLTNFNTGARKANRNPTELEVVMNLHIYATEDGKIGNDLREQIGYWIANRVSDEVASSAGLDLDEISGLRSAYRESGRDGLAAKVSRQTVEAFCAAGTPESCLKKLREYQNVGVTHTILMPFGGNLELAMEIGSEFIRRRNKPNGSSLKMS